MRPSAFWLYNVWPKGLWQNSSFEMVKTPFWMVMMLMSKEFGSLIDKMFFSTFSDHCNLYCYGYGILLVLLLLVHGHFSRWGLIVGLGPALRSQKPVWWHRQSMRPHCDSHHSSFLCFSLSDAECWSVCRGQPKFGALTLWLYFNDVVDSHVVTNGGNGIIDLSVETKLKVSRQ